MSGVLKKAYELNDLRDAHIAIGRQAAVIVQQGGAIPVVDALSANNKKLRSALSSVWETSKWPLGTTVTEDMAIPVATDLLATWAAHERTPQRAGLYRHVGANFETVGTQIESAPRPAKIVPLRRTSAASPRSGAQLLDI